MDRRNFIKQSSLSLLGMGVLPMDTLLGNTLSLDPNSTTPTYITQEVTNGGILIRILRWIGGKLVVWTSRLFKWIKENGAKIVYEIAQWINEVAEAVDRVFHFPSLITPYFRTMYDEVEPTSSKPITVKIINDTSKFYTLDIFNQKASAWGQKTLHYQPGKNVREIGAGENVYKVAICGRDFLNQGSYLFRESGEYRLSNLHKVANSTFDNKYKVNAPGTGLKLRRGKSKYSTHIITMRHGALIEVLEMDDSAENINAGSGKKAGSWWKVKYGKHVGYCFSTYLKKYEP